MRWDGIWLWQKNHDLRLLFFPHLPTTNNSHFTCYYCPQRNCISTVYFNFPHLYQRIYTSSKVSGCDKSDLPRVLQPFLHVHSGKYPLDLSYSIVQRCRSRCVQTWTILDIHDPVLTIDLTEPIYLVDWIGKAAEVTGHGWVGLDAMLSSFWLLVRWGLVRMGGG
jgi:hypothetical protein